MANFEYLKNINEYALFSAAAIEAEKVFASSPAMCAVGCRKALELAVKWVYAADNTITMPYRENIQSLLHEPTFRFAVDARVWSQLLYIVRLGNLAVHTDQNIAPSDALASLRALFEFIDWIDYCYGSEYEARQFDAKQIPKNKVNVDVKRIKEQESLLEERAAEIERLRKQIEEMSEQYTESKQENQNTREFVVKDISEFETRKRYIDIDLKYLGWHLGGNQSEVYEEYPVDDMENKPGQQGFVDYVLFGKDGLPLAVIEAKRSSKDPNVGRQQAVLYADCLERKFGRRPMMFTTNGFETYFWDDTHSPQGRVSGLFSRDDLQRLMNRRTERKDLQSVTIDEKITDRYYQKEAIRAVCDSIEQKFRKFLLVMATGTGKTRTASSLTDVLSRGNHITNILFLADRTELVKQAKDDFKNYLPDMSLCNLCSGKDDRNARIVFSTYPTMLNAIDSVRTKDGFPLYSPAHFDLIILDEAHRSIFKKYRAIFEYFDAMLVGLTATPKMEVDHNTYDFFEVEHGVPTYAYDYETAVYQDHVLVPYFNYEVKTKFLEEGITYDDLSEADKERYEDDFVEDGFVPDFVPSAALNNFVFNEKTVDLVLQDLMERGIKTDSGDRLGKTIIFAQNKRHAEFIIQRFRKLYPNKDNGKFCQRVICDDAYAGTIISNFKKADSTPHIVVSVDMMDTGIDVPECVNLVFFKKVRSKTKFWQMIGRGTRLAPELLCTDEIDGEYLGKRRFLIFDYCGNFEFFREKPNGFEGKEAKSLSESIYGKEVTLIVLFQGAEFAQIEYQDIRGGLVKRCLTMVQALNNDLVSVRLQKQYVEKYAKEEVFTCLSEGDKGELIDHIAPLVHYDDNDVDALRFDSFMYGLMIAQAEQSKLLKRSQNTLRHIAEKLEQKATIPQVQAKIQLIKSINTEDFWAGADLLTLENVRKDLRELLKFLDQEPKKIIITHLNDPVIESKAGEALDAAYDFEDYRKKVNRYMEEHGDSIAIHKLKNNVPLTRADYQELERVLTQELGNREDYEREFGDTPFGLLIRKITKLDHEAAMSAFSKFIDDEALNQKQIAFVHKIINHVEQNGYMEDVTLLTKPPFDKPVSFVKMFDNKTRTELIDTLNHIRENAEKVIA